MKTSESIKEIAKALITFHDEVENIPKTAQNPFYKSKYVPLDKILTAIREPLKKANLSMVQFPEGEGGMTTLLMHTSGEWVEATYFMKPTKADPQGFGSVITYQRRYALSSILGLNTDEDDDGNAASAEPKATPITTTKKPKILPGSEKWVKAVEFIKGGGTIQKIKDSYDITEDHIQELILQSGS